ncbi:MAG: hypothetical protein IJU40_05800 [Desulfovibrionaceae bacterium]|nr:hypothetical protein [Desulfovibrionaceae bacterium]
MIEVENIIEKKIINVIRKKMLQQKEANQEIIGASLRDIYRSLNQSKKFIEDLKDILITKQYITNQTTDKIKSYYEKYKPNYRGNLPEYYILIKDIE